MRLAPLWRGWIRALIQPEPSPQLETALAEHRASVPVLWLLGKTGSGKSSVIQRLTGDSRAQIGNGFEPCTKTAMQYEHPVDAPVMRFLDTRGLGEAHYDPAEDMKVARSGSHALLILTRVDDPAQGMLTDALESLSPAAEDLVVLHVHTALHTQTGDALTRAISFNAQQISNALKREVPQVQIDFTAAEDDFDDPNVGLADLRDAIMGLVPELSQVLARRVGQDQEESLFLAHRKEILGYSSAAAAADVLPAVGLIAVPTLQGKMLHALAGRYGVAWDKRRAGEFVATMGTSFLYRYALSLGGRQLGKLIPVYGQSVGAAAAASVSFASTYALGRAVCIYLYRLKHRQELDPDAMREAFRQAFREQKR